ncbi:MAG: hypothetical protein KKB51_13645 [Candidatus Riflebacteria bacterium]|nr:hypothetical protein [Candidatus Riflebacteria bacterium]
MKINNLNTILGIVLFTAIVLLSGFNTPQAEYFPAPLAQPAVCLYLNLSASGLYDRDEVATNASQEIVSYIENLCIARGAAKTESHHIRTAAENLLNDRLLSGQFKVYELFFYFTDQANFALIMRGEFARQRLTEIIGSDKVVNGDNTSSAQFRSPVLPQEMLHLQISHDEIVICPENISGNIMTLLESRHNQLGKEFDAFSKMYKARPAIAGEINLTALQPNFADMNVPGWFKSLRYTRLIMGSRMNKMQLFVPEAEERLQLLRQVESVVGNLREYAGNLVDFSSAINGNSIFIEAPAGQEIERLISSRSIAFLMHFFVRAEKNRMLVSTSSGENQKANDK